VFLGTDSLASSASLSLFDEMRAFLDAQPAATPDIALRMVTADPGEFLMPGTGLGTLRPGAPADLIAVPARRSEPLTAVTAHRGRVPLVIARGAVLRNTVA
jgi:cytosine/adenosine deaminase-related metal-dependent hydrolase